MVVTLRFVQVRHAAVTWLAVVSPSKAARRWLMLAALVVLPWLGDEPLAPDKQDQYRCRAVTLMVALAVTLALRVVTAVPVVAACPSSRTPLESPAMRRWLPEARHLIQGRC
jgi:hypothetical protein